MKTTADNHHIYSCPMHPEITGKEGASCPKCGMKLQLTGSKHSSPQPDYYMDFTIDPVSIKAGNRAKLTFRPKIRGDERIPVALDIQHQKKIHLIIVNKSLSYFDHVHPELQSDGSYVVNVLSEKDKSIKSSNDTRFAEGGEYVLFVDYRPKGAPSQLQRIELAVTGPVNKIRKSAVQRTVSTIGRFEVSLVPYGGKFFSEGESQITVIFLKEGKEIAPYKFQDYIGAKAHVVAISEDTKDFLHVHPVIMEDRLLLQTNFGKPGFFRTWLQFQIDGKVYTADFLLHVEKGKALVGTSVVHHH